MKSGSHIKIKYRVIFARFFQLFIIVCLIDGFLDIIYPAAKETVSYLKSLDAEMSRPTHPVSGSVEDVLEPVQARMHQLPYGLPGVFEEFHSPKVNIAADGMRFNGQPFPEKILSTVYVFGSSPAWGHGLADNQTLSAHLERDLEHTRVKNYAGWYESLTGNILRWDELIQKKKNPSLVLIAGGSTDIYQKCNMHVDPFRSDGTNIILHIYRKIVSGPLGPYFICSSERTVSLIVKDAIFNIKNAVEFARHTKTPFYIVYLPLPYDKNVNVQNLKQTPYFQMHLSDLQHAYELYHSALKNLHIPELIDLSQALPENELYFLDRAGHLSGHANEILAAKIAERIRQDHISASE